MDAVSTGSATIPEPIIPMAKTIGPQSPTAGRNASAACRVVMSGALLKCRTALAAIMIEHARTNVTAVDNHESAA